MNNKKLAVFDLDGTLFRWQMDHEVMYELESMGDLQGFSQALKKPLAQWKDRANNDSFKTYEKIFDETVNHYLPKISIERYNQAVNNVIQRSGQQVYGYTRKLITDLKNQGYTLVAISGSLKGIVEPFATLHGFDIIHAQTLSIKNDRFTGVYSGLSAGRKAELLKDLFESRGFQKKGSIGVGDTMGDAKMLGLVETPIAFNPNRQLMQYAMKKGWKIVVERKNVAYELTSQGDNHILHNAEVNLALA